ncbi:MAG: uroporphyrinogen-III C-methyltransferase [Myxococcota bacterium]
MSQGAGDGKGAVGRVVLVGAGPGDPDLITLRGAKALSRADVVLYDQLAIDELLDLAPSRALRINVGKRGHEEPTQSQDEINALIRSHALAGRNVVRLKGGDPLVFGRGGEEISVCAEAGIPFEIVPGVTSAIAALSYAGIPVTDRRHSASFAVVTGHKDPSRPAEQTRWRELGTAVDTLIILMGMRNLPKLVTELIAGGKSPDTPAAAVMHGTLSKQKTCVSTLAELPQAVKAAGLGAPSAIVVGEVVTLRDGLSWWETQPLFGRQVLVTRALEQSAEISSALRTVGALPVVMPMIELCRVEDAPTREEIDRVLGAVDDFGSIVFTSSNAVRFFAEELAAHAERTGDDKGRAGGRSRLREGTRTFCIGERTAAEALDAGFPVSVVASGRSDAEALLAQLLQSFSPGEERVLIPRSRIARTTIADGLAAAGVRVDSIAFYENRRPEVDEPALRARFMNDEILALTFTSPSTVEHFLAALDGPSRAAAEKCICVAIGRTTARALEAAGLSPHVVPPKPDVQSMVDELVEEVRRR